MEQRGPVREVADQLGRVFRHLLPGVLIVAAARASHPRWFSGRLDWGQPWQLAVVAVIAVMVGNTWYVVHRYTVHQVVDCVVQRLTRTGKQPYVEWLAQHVYLGNLFPSHAEGLREHILFRSAQVIYLFIVGEVAVFFAWQPASGTVVARYRWWLLVTGAIVLLFACWQYYLTSEIDAHAVGEVGGKRSAA